MAVKARADITLSSVIDVKAYYRYYLLQSSTLTKPAKPTAYPPPSPWNDAEPAYTEGSTNSLYVVECTVFSNDTYEYSPVSLSSSYEAAKQAYNKAQSALTKATTVETTTSAAITQLTGEVNLKASKTEVTTEITQKIAGVKIGGRNLIIRKTSTPDMHVDKTGTVSVADGLNISLTDYIPITPGMEYTFSRSAGEGDYFRFAWYNNATPDPVFINRVALTQFTAGAAMTYTWTAPANAYNLRVSYPVDGASEAKLEEGNKATDYSPAPEDMATINDTERLESVVNENSATIADLSELVVGAGGIQATVESIKTDVNKAYNDLGEVIERIQSAENKLAVTMSSEEIDFAIQSKLSNGVSQVVTETGITVNSYGISVDKSGAGTWTRITEDGMKVFESATGNEALVANSNGVDARNLHATTYLIIGENSRFEDYKENRTGCFWIGG
jgi:hypothetical protein